MTDIKTQEDYDKEFEELNKKVNKFTSLLNEFGFDYRRECCGELTCLILELDEEKDKLFSIDFYDAGRVGMSLIDKEDLK